MDEKDFAVLKERRHDLSPDQAHHEQPMLLSTFEAHAAAWETEQILIQHLMSGHEMYGGPGDMDGLKEFHRYLHPIKQFEMADVEPLGEIKLDVLGGDLDLISPDETPLTTITAGEDSMTIAHAAGNISYAADMLGALLDSLSVPSVFLSHEHMGAQAMRVTEVVAVDGGIIIRRKKR